MQILAEKGVSMHEMESLFRSPLDRDLSALYQSGQLHHLNTANTSVGRESQSYNQSQNSGKNITSAFLSNLERNVETKLENLFSSRKENNRKDTANIERGVVGRESQSYNESQNSEDTQATAFLNNIARNVEQSPCTPK